MAVTDDIPGSYQLLLAQLRRAGLQVTPRHYLQLGHILAQEPQGDSDQLRGILRALIVKSPVEAQHFDRVYRDWQPKALAALEQTTQKASATAASIPAAVVRWQKNKTESQQADPKGKEKLLTRHLTAAVLLLLLGVALYFALLPMFNGDGVIVAPPQFPPAEKKTSPDLNLPLQDRVFNYLAPQITFEPNRAPLWPWALIGGLGLAGMLFLRFKIAPRGLPKPVKPSLANASTGLPPHALAEAGPRFQLLDNNQRKGMTWGLQKFLSEQTTKRLDQCATVAATAREAGVLTPVFEGARLDSTVWLWLDESIPDPAAARLADEIYGQLKAAGIPVRQANFWGTPDRLVTTGGRHLRPQDLDEHRQEILVVILSDGQGLLHALDQPRGGHLKTLLGLLRHWPRLVLVDFSEQANLTDLTAQYQLDRVTPAGLASYLGRDCQQINLPRTKSEWADEGLWAAAAALPPLGCSEQELLALPDALDLQPDPWVLSDLVRGATDGGQRREWPLSERALRLRWLTSLGDLKDGCPKDDSPLKCALLFWVERYNQAIDAIPEAQQQHTYHLRLRMERALIGLWHTPETAAVELRELTAYQWSERQTDSLLAETIHAQLAMHTPADRQQKDLITLPWRTDQISPATRAILQELGLGGGMPREILTQPGRYWLAMGSAAGTVATAMLGAWLNWQFPLQGPIEIVDDAQTLVPHQVSVLKGDDLHKPITDATDQDFVAVIHPRGASLSQPAESGQRAVIDWLDKQLPCYVVESARTTQDTSKPADTEGLYQIFHQYCSSGAPQPRLAGANVPRSIAVLFSAAQGSEPKSNRENRQILADGLIAGGSVDEAIIVNKTINEDKPFSPLDLLTVERHSQLLLFSTEAEGKMIDFEPANLARAAWVKVRDWSKAAERLRFEGVRSLDETFGREQVSVLSGVPANLRVGGISQLPVPPLPDLAPIAGGCFQMGSSKGEPGHLTNEEPQHEVCLKGFRMGRHEVTFEQYDAFARATGRELPDDRDWGRDSRPVIHVNWNDARAYAHWLSTQVGMACGLPSEAEWEYAARAGTSTPYALPAPDGSDDISGKGLANCNGCGSEWDNKQTSPVGSFAANAWDLHDMQGNVWEWVQDPWHDSYAGAPNDGSAREDSSSKGDDWRVLRGGSWLDDPVDLRSADRSGLPPDFRYFSFGFRVLCRPHSAER